MSTAVTIIQGYNLFISWLIVIGICNGKEISTKQRGQCENYRAITTRDHINMQALVAVVIDKKKEVVWHLDKVFTAPWEDFSRLCVYRVPM
jgi:hypothetical protein